MKKFVLAAFALVLSLCMVACSKKTSPATYVGYTYDVVDGSLRLVVAEYTVKEDSTDMVIKGYKGTVVDSVDWSGKPSKKIEWAEDSSDAFIGSAKASAEAKAKANAEAGKLEAVNTADDGLVMASCNIKNGKLSGYFLDACQVNYDSMTWKQTKYTLKNNYGMSAIGKEEWYVQADFIAKTYERGGIEALTKGENGYFTLAHATISDHGITAILTKLDSYAK